MTLMPLSITMTYLSWFNYFQILSVSLLKYLLSNNNILSVKNLAPLFYLLFFFKHLRHLKIMNWVWMGMSSQTDVMHQQWNCPVCFGVIQTNVKNTDFNDLKIKSIEFPKKSLVGLCLSFVMRNTQINLNILWIWVDFLNFHILPICIFSWKQQSDMVNGFDGY